MRSISTALLALSAGMLIVELWTMFYASMAMRAAEAQAGGNPYCIQTAADRLGYRPVRSWLDLSPLTMRSRFSSGLYLQSHAILVVRVENNLSLLHWSYTAREFHPYRIDRQDSLQWPAIFCHPDLRGGFDTPENESTMRVHFANRDLAIPRSYAPSFTSGPTLLFFATEPTFEPVANVESLERLKRFDWMVDVYFNPRDLLEVWSKPSKQGEVVERDATGKVETLVSCFPARKEVSRSCQNRFLRDGRLYYFRHAPTEPDKWRAMQDRFVQVVRSFEESQAQ